MSVKFDEALAAAVLALSASAGAAVPRPEYPRPQFERAEWVNLNGDDWTVELDPGASGAQEGRELFRSRGFSRRITVPFCIESPLSGIGHVDFMRQVWYHRKVAVPEKWRGRKILLNFGAVDFECEIFVDGRAVDQHFGGFASFSVDLTPYVEAGGEHDLVVRVFNDPAAVGQPRGKQCDKYASYGCLYTRVTGIWQTVWMEAVDPLALRQCRVVPDFDNSTFIFTPQFFAVSDATLHIAVTDAGGAVVGSAESRAADGAAVAIRIPGAQAWCPDNPYLYGIRYEVRDAKGRLLDSVRSYAGMRKFHCAGGKFWLNNRPCYLRFALDQGYYPDGIWTAPSDDALRRDVELALAAGFNGARLHQKVFEERFHYWADRLGYLTVGETGSWGATGGDHEGARNFLAEWTEIVRRDANHPSIVMWAPANETYFAARRSAAHARSVQRLLGDIYELTKGLDPTRPVNTSSGGTFYRTDAWSRHHAWLAREPQFKSGCALEALTLSGEAKDTNPSFRNTPYIRYAGQPIWIDEFGGYWFPNQDTPTPKLDIFPKDEAGRLADYELQIDFFMETPYIAGWCIVQLYDVEQEQNGVYDYWRRPKIDIGKVRAIFSKDKYSNKGKGAANQ